MSSRRAVARHDREIIVGVPGGAALTLCAVLVLAAAGSCSKTGSNTLGSGGTGGTEGAAGGTGGDSEAGGNTAGATGTGGTQPGTGGAGNGGSSAAGSGGVAQQNGGSSGAAGAIDPGAPAVRFVGRFDRSDPAGPKFEWSGSGILARFQGTSVGVKLNAGQQFTVVLDGVVRPKLVPAGGTSSIATGLVDGPHSIEIYRRVEAHDGTTQFLGFDFGAGQLLAPYLAPDRRIEVIGDSITTGYGNLGPNSSCVETPDMQDHYQTYEAIAARNLGADLITPAWSGMGVVCNYGDGAASCQNPFPTMYDRTLPTQAASKWDYSSWQPHAVVVNLGTNDFSTTQDPTQMQFVDGYKAFLQHIRSVYPNALILCTCGPLLSGADLATAKADIAMAVAALGDAKIKTFDLGPSVPNDGAGCDGHPSLKTHAKLAIQLQTKLKAELGW